MRTNYSTYIPKDIVFLCYLFFNGDDLNEYIDRLKKCDLISQTQILFMWFNQNNIAGRKQYC